MKDLMMHWRNIKEELPVFDNKLVEMKIIRLLIKSWVFIIVFILSIGMINPAPGTYIRHNLAGYLPDESKVALAFSNEKIYGKFLIIDANTGLSLFQGKIKRSKNPTWNNFQYYYFLDFTEFTKQGDYQIKLEASGTTTEAFRIGKKSV